MFKRVLIANRGLIQANCVRAVKELGATAITLYEEEDRDSAGVRNADEAYKLESSDRRVRPYLDIDQIVTLAEQLEVDAVHPGYGFLAQNAKFARRLESRGIALVAPSSADSINLSNKHVVKEAAKAAGLPLIPGSPSLSDSHELHAAAKRLGYPLVMKATHGFGGIGMQVITDESGLDAAFEHIQGLSRKFRMNSPEVFLEAYQSGVRHIEFPVLRDADGRTLVFPELDCSLQRRFQKLTSETPAPDFNPDLRAHLESEVRVLCERLGIFGFASVEFLIRGREAWFLEINGYIQPSHTATTLLTGIDLLKEQIRLVSGEPLTVRLDRPCTDRSVLCTYIFAEDPERNFEPSPGQVDRLYLPFGEDVFMQTSIFSGATVSPFYDPMIAKLLVRGLSRQEAILKMQIALDEFFVEGVRTNIPLLRGVLKSREFHEPAITPEFLSRPEDRTRLIESLKSDADFEVASLVAALALHRDGDTLKRIESMAAERTSQSVLGAATRWLKPRNRRRPL